MLVATLFSWSERQNKIKAFGAMLKKSWEYYQATELVQDVRQILSFNETHAYPQPTSKGRYS